jgi:hypothetical protein
MRRKIPIFRVSMEKGAKYSQLKDIPGIKEAVIEETVYAIKYGIEKNKTTIPLFEVAHSDYYIDLAKKEWKSTLKHVIEYFIEKEEYKMCAEVRDLINKL